MTKRAEVRRLLSGLDQPRSPSEEFADRLWAEVSGDQDTQRVDRADAVDARSSDDTDGTLVPLIPTDGTDSDRRPSRALWAAAAAACLLLVLVAVAALWGDTRADRVTIGSTPEQTRGGVDEDAVRAACRTFMSTAFGDLTRSQAFSATNGSVLTTREAALDASNTFRSAFEQLQASLSTAGVNSNTYAREAARVVAALDSTDRFLTDSNDLPTGLGRFASIDERLTAFSRVLTSQGIATCM